MPFKAHPFSFDEPETMADAPNRHGLDRALIRFVAEDIPVGLLFVAVDQFRTLEEARGRAAGDRVLAALSRVLRAQSRKGDFVARYGNDEFVVLLRGASHEVTTKLAAQIGGAVERLVVPGVLPHFTVSIGTALREAASGEPADELLSRAELALDEARVAGKNRVVNAPGLAKARAEVADSGVPGPRTCVTAA
jgi:diguanylate cyclase (GGDEF)-like protein